MHVAICACFFLSSRPFGETLECETSHHVDECGSIESSLTTIFSELGTSPQSNSENGCNHSGITRIRHPMRSRHRYFETRLECNSLLLIPLSAPHKLAIFDQRWCPSTGQYEGAIPTTLLPTYCDEHVQTVDVHSRLLRRLRNTIRVVMETVGSSTSWWFLSHQASVRSFSSCGATLQCRYDVLGLHNSKISYHDHQKVRCLIQNHHGSFCLGVGRNVHKPENMILCIGGLPCAESRLFFARVNTARQSNLHHSLNALNVNAFGFLSLRLANWMTPNVETFFEQHFQPHVKLI